MKTQNFTKLVQAITGRDFTIEERIDWRTSQPTGETLLPEKTYFIKRTLLLTGRTVGFDWKTPKTEEKMLRSFITAFTSKYREPDPATYVANAWGGQDWSSYSPERQESAFGHHANHMLSKEKLMGQIEARFGCREIESALNQWGFYETEYGIGIVCFWQTRFVRNAMDKMREFLKANGVAAKEEFSDARWVYRFRVEASREIHVGLLKRFSNQAEATN
jgi:hypothetical protein